MRAYTRAGITFIAKAVNFWNSLPDKLKDYPNIKSFMRAYTSHFAAMNADLDEFTVLFTLFLPFVCSLPFI